jgi:hypothetical protein
MGRHTLVFGLGVAVCMRWESCTGNSRDLYIMGYRCWVDLVTHLDLLGGRMDFAQCSIWNFSFVSCLYVIGLFTRKRRAESIFHLDTRRLNVGYA